MTHFGKGAVLAFFFVAALSAQASEIEMTISAEGYSEADATAALDTFRRNCRPLGYEFWSDVTNIKVEIVDELAPHRLARGWHANVHLALKYSDDPQVGPAFASGTGVLAGHTLHYDLGGGSTPGYLASKQSSQYLCGLSFNANGDDVFEGVPELKFLDR